MMRFSRVALVLACLFIPFLAFGQPVALPDDASTIEDTPVTFNVTDNDSDLLFGINPSTVDLDQAAAGIQNSATTTEGSWVVDNAGNVTYTPAPDFFGTASINYTVRNTLIIPLPSLPTAINVTVTAVNDDPTITSIADQTIAQNSNTGALDFTIGDVETAPGSLVVTGTSSNTTLVQNAGITFGGSGANRTVTVTPELNQSGTATITITVDDGTTSVSTDFQLEVTAVNTPPTISAIGNQSTPENTPTSAISFTVGDAETAAGSLTVTGTSGNTALVPTANIAFGGSGANRTVTLTPAAGQSGTSTITITVSDGTANASTDFTLTVDAVNDAPTISAISDQSTPENTPTGAIAFTIGDSDNAVGTLIVSGTSGNTTLVPDANIVFGGSGANRTVTLTPAANQSGTTTITITVSDGTATASTNFTLTVSDVNDPPVISAISDQTTPENTPTAAIPFTVNDAETPVADLTLTASSSNPSLVPVANISFGGSGANRTVTINPGASQSGTATITITVSDGASSASTAFQLTIDAVNDAPTITPISNQTTAENTPTPAIPFSIGDAETPASNLLVSATSSVATLVSNGNIVIGGTGSDRTITITPTAGQSGVAEITITVSDGTATTSTSFTLTVSSVDDAPTITAISNQTTDEDVATAALPFTLSDPDTPATGLTVTGSSSNKTLVPDANIVLFGDNVSRTVTIVPAANQSGTTTITLTVSDGTASASTTFQVTVNPVNDPPVISAIANQTTAESTATPAIAFTVTDVDTPASSLVVTGSSSNVDLVPNANIVVGGSGENRTVTITPAAGQGGSTTITLSVTDGTATVSGTFQLTVTSVNDAPTISAIPAQSTLEDVPTGQISFTIADSDTPPGSLTVTGSSSNKTLVPDANIAISNSGTTRTVVITPAVNQNGTTTITLTVSDGTASAQTTFQLTVNPVNDPPVIAAQVPLTTQENTPITLLPEHFTIQDPDNESAFSIVVVISAGAGYSVKGSTVTPPLNFNGELTVFVRAFDGKVEGPIFPATITVTDINLPPVILGQREIRQPVDRQWTLLITDLETADPDTPQNELVVTALPGENYLVSGPGRTFITPSQNFEGVLHIPVTVSDGTSTTEPFILEVLVFQPGQRPSINGHAPLIIDEDTPYVLELLDLNVSDADDTYPEGFSMNIANGDNYTVVGRTITPALNFNGILEVSVTVSDGEFPSEPFEVKILVRPINDPPEITALESNSILYEPGSGPTPISEIFECTDVDNDYLNLAEVGLIDPFYSPDNDELIFEDTENSAIRGIYDAARGVLSLIGYATIEEYIAAIRSIKYNYRLTVEANGDPSQISTEPKKIYVNLSDGQATSETRERSIELETLVGLDIPNAFTPNGDSENNTWAVQPFTNTDQYSGTVIKVYNKRGLLVYEAVGLDKEWDGTYNGEELPVDTYYYTIDLKLSFIKKTYKGAVMILR